MLLKFDQAEAGEVQLVALPESVQPGQEVSLTWRAEGQRAFLSGVGLVESSGTRKVAPRETTTYSLVTEGPASAIKMVTITVSGGKGESEFPTDLERFKFPISSKCTVSSLVDFLYGVHRLLQDEMKFSLRESTTPSEHILFLTHSAERAELLKNDSERIAARRISYLVEVEKRQPPGEVSVSIKALIEYRRKREATWRQENDAALYQGAEAQMRARIESLR